jgi:hypothetical protein
VSNQNARDRIICRTDACGIVSQRYDLPAVRRQQFQKQLRVTLDVAVQECLAIGIDDAQIHGFGVQVDPTVKWIPFVKKPHHALLSGK